MFFKKKSSPASVYTFPFSTDLHSHILPGIDDGSPDVETSLKLIRGMYDLGIRKMVATPHVIGDLYRNTPETINTALEKVKQACADEKIEMDISAAAEYMMDDHFMQLLNPSTPLRTERLLTIQDNLLLVEIPYTAPPYDLEEMIFQMITEGYQPLLAHPERYFYYHRDMKEYEKLKELGFLLQVNLLSLTGYYGKGAAKVAGYLIEKGLADFVGSDMHHERHLNGLKEGMGIFEKRLVGKKWNDLDKGDLPGGK
jgi:tyrosine-protein phosphatase YwqE